MRSEAAQPSLAWAGGCAALASLCVMVWLLPVEAQISLRWQRTDGLAQAWTLWTASLTHLSDAHLIVNLLALLCLGVIGHHVGAGRAEVIAFLPAWPLSNLALLLWPEIQFYAGFSGLNHALALMIVAKCAMDFIVDRHLSIIAFFLALMMLARLIHEAPWVSPLRMDASWGFTVVQAAHLTGAVSACLAFVGLQLARILFTKAVVE